MEDGGGGDRTRKGLAEGVFVKNPNVVAASTNFSSYDRNLKTKSDL